MLLFGKTAFIIHDLDASEKQISKAEINKEGKLVKIKKSSSEELEKALSDEAIPEKVFIKEPIFENLKELFGKDVEVMVHN